MSDLECVLISVNELEAINSKIEQLKQENEKLILEIRLLRKYSTIVNYITKVEKIDKNK